MIGTIRAKMGACALAIALAAGVGGAWAAEEAVHAEHQKWSFAGLFGKFDDGQLQRGFKVYSEVCARCHSIKRLHFRNLVQAIIIEPKLIEFIARIVNETRNNPALYLGASPRASLAILKSAKANAAVKGRDFVTPEDIVEMAPHVLRHRIILTPEKEMEGITADDLIDSILKAIEVPR